jgi:hypothetical protein
MIEATFISPCTDSPHQGSLTPITHAYPAPAKPVRGPIADHLAGLRVPLAIWRYPSLTRQQFEAMQADPRYLLWTWVEWSADGASLADNYETPLDLATVEDRLMAWGAFPLPAALDTLWDVIADAQADGVPFYRADVAACLADLPRPQQIE